MVKGNRIQLLSCALIIVLYAAIAKGCMDPPNLYASYPSALQNYFNRPRSPAIETVGGLPASMSSADIRDLLFYRGRHRLGKRRNSGCGDGVQTWGKIHVEDRALCNWRYLPKHNSSRYPNIVVEAESTCHECSGIGRGLSALRGRCEPVYRSFPILERTGCIHGIYQYEQAYISVKVAFVCAMPRKERAEEIVDPELVLRNYL